MSRTSWFDRQNLQEYLPEIIEHYESLDKDDLYLRFNNTLTMDSIIGILNKKLIDPCNDYFFFIVRHKETNKIVGLCELGVNEETNIGEISVSVTSKYKEMGLGFYMLTQMLDKVREKKIKRVEMYLSYDNVPCRCLANKMNFEISFEPSYNLFLAVYSGE